MGVRRRGAPTEKLDGTNVRLTVRGGHLVRVEKRRNPTKLQKKQGITDGWYVDTAEGAAEDKWILAAARNTDVTAWPDGEHSCEALGPRIQGNPLELDDHRCVPFNMEVPVYQDVPRSYTGLRDFLTGLDSRFAPARWPRGSSSTTRTGAAPRSSARTSPGPPEHGRRRFGRRGGDSGPRPSGPRGPARPAGASASGPGAGGEVEEVLALREGGRQRVAEQDVQVARGEGVGVQEQVRGGVGAELAQHGLCGAAPLRPLLQTARCSSSRPSRSSTSSARAAQAASSGPTPAPPAAFAAFAYASATRYGDCAMWTSAPTGPPSCTARSDHCTNVLRR
ncbi:hypothetical protein ACFQ0M_07530 [Kitasatospora aburaviensis]